MRHALPSTAALLLMLQSCAVPKGVSTEFSGTLSDGSSFKGYVLSENASRKSYSCSISSQGYQCRSKFVAAESDQEIAFDCGGGVTGTSKTEAYRDTEYGRFASRAWVTMSTGEVGAIEFREPKLWGGEDLCSKL